MAQRGNEKRSLSVTASFKAVDAKTNSLKILKSFLRYIDHKHVF